MRGDSRRGTEGGWERGWGHQGSRQPVSHTFSSCGPERWGSRGPGKEWGREGQGRTGAPPTQALQRGQGRVG